MPYDTYENPIQLYFYSLTRPQCFQAPFCHLFPKFKWWILGNVVFLNRKRENDYDNYYGGFWVMRFF